MDEAIAELSLSCSPADAGKAMYLLCAPANEMSMDIAKELGEYLRSMAPKATIRNGDYPNKRDTLGVHVIFSELSNVEKIRNYYAKSVDLIPEFQKRQVERELSLKDMEDIGKDIPSLL